MRIKIISNYRSECDATFSTTDEVVPGIGDEVIWEYQTNEQGWKSGGRVRGTVKKRTINYTIVPTRTDRSEVTLQMQDTQPVFDIPGA